jgi:hypothetical protein
MRILVELLRLNFWYCITRWSIYVCCWYVRLNSVVTNILTNILTKRQPGGWECWNTKVEVGDDPSSSVVVYLSSPEEQRCWHSMLTAASSWQRSNTYACWQMTTESERWRNPSLIDTIDSKYPCPRHIECFRYILEKKLQIERLTKWEDLETRCWQCVSTFPIIISLELKETAITSG